jgi:hypothetical protein
MTQLGPFLVLIVVAAVALAALGAVVGWYNEEGRRIRRGLRKVLEGETHALIIAHGRGRGAGFNFTRNQMAVAWDSGEWCLIYRMEELLGVELIVDSQVAGRAFRGEPRRPLDVVGGAEQQVSLRMVFDDPQHADFILELWSASRAARGRPALNADEAVEEANRWLARIESIFRRKPAGVAARVAARAAERERQPAPEPARPAPMATAAAAAPEREPEPAPAAAAAAPSAAAPAAMPAARQELPFEDEAPWDEDDQATLL